MPILRLEDVTDMMHIAELMAVQTHAADPEIGQRLDRMELVVEQLQRNMIKK